MKTVLEIVKQRGFTLEIELPLIKKTLTVEVCW